MAVQFISDFTIYYLSERALTLQFGDTIDTALTEKVNSFNKMLLKNPFPGFLSTVPAYNTLSIFFDPVIVYDHPEFEGVDCYDKISSYLLKLSTLSRKTDQQVNEIIEIPVYYGGQHGPDLNQLAEIHQLQSSEIIKMHSEISYTVGMIGFLPGFAYLTGLNHKLESPRRQSPRKIVPAGSVGIAGKQTGIYSLQTPGGWRIIGRTPLIMFDATRPQPSLLKNGDRVVFKPISAEEFDYLTNNARANTHP